MKIVVESDRITFSAEGSGNNYWKEVEAIKEIGTITFNGQTFVLPIRDPYGVFIKRGR